MRYAKDGEQGEVMPTVQNEIVRDGFARGMKYERCVCVFGRPNRMILFQGKVEKQVVVYMHSLNDWIRRR